MNQPSRPRRITPALPIGVGGIPPFPPSGPVVAMRIVRRGIEIALDPERKEWQVGREGPPTNDIALPFETVSRVHASFTRSDGAIQVADLGSKNGIAPAHRRDWSELQSFDSAIVHPGMGLRIGSERLLALDEPLARLVPVLTAFCPPGGHDQVDDALIAIASPEVILLPAHRRAEAIELARSIHLGTARRDYPFVIIEEPPIGAAAIDALCTESGCGTLVLDLSTSLALVPDRLVSNLYKPFGYHLRCFVIVDVFGGYDRSCAALWRRRAQRDLCFVGFPHGFDPWA